MQLVCGKMLNRLSPELVELIAGELHWSDLLALRSVCRYLWRATYAQFTAARFATLDLDLTPRNLLRLTNIAQHGELASAVRCLRISTRYLLKTPVALGEGHSWPRLENGCLDLTRQPAKDFRNSLIRFTRCTEVRVVQGLFPLDGKPDDVTGIKFTLQDAWYIMLSLLGKDEGLLIREFVADFALSPLSTRETRLPPSLVDGLAQTSWSSHLQHLDISWVITEEIANVLAGLVIAAVHVRSIVLHLQPCGSESASAQAAFFEQLVQAPQLPPQLNKLKLTYILDGVAPETLSRVIARFQGSIKSLLLGMRHYSAEDFHTFRVLLAKQNLHLLEWVGLYGDFGGVTLTHLPEQCRGKFEWRVDPGLAIWTEYTGSGEEMRLALQTFADL